MSSCLQFCGTNATRYSTSRIFQGHTDQCFVNDLGQKLKKLSDTGNAKVGLDFRNVFTASNNVTISIWHNTGDDCGPPCYYLHQFFDEIADVSNTLVPGASW